MCIAYTILGFVLPKALFSFQEIAHLMLMMSAYHAIVNHIHSRNKDKKVITEKEKSKVLHG